MKKILLVEDDLSLVDGLCYSLNKQGFDVENVRTVQAAKEILEKDKYDLLILDLSLPDGSGYEICQSVRKTSKVPIIFLTAMDDEIDIVRGLDMGGDDYITKPFKLSVLFSRINALLRRTNDFGTSDNLSSNGIKVSLLTNEVFKNERLLELTSVERKLLYLFIQNPNILLSKETILNKLWDSNGNYVDDNTLAVYIRRLRMKIEDDPGNPKILITIRSVGYKWQIIS